MEAAPTLSTQTKQLARQLGATAGIAPPQVSPVWVERHKRWLARGFHGDMSYLARNPQSRYDAASLLPGCESVVVLAVNYWQPDMSPARPGIRVSRYAWGADYHEVLGEKLKAIGDWLVARAPGTGWKACVDHSPLSEKAFAIAAGLGWEGRNSLLLTPEAGSYVFLGLLLTTTRLEADTPLEADCGACSLCLRACPAGALVGPGMLDARRCISYVTTERKAVVGAGDDLHGWAFGCDDCQDICPFNADLPVAIDQKFMPRDWVKSLDLKAELAMDHSAFAIKYEGTVVKRRRLERWQAQLRAASAGLNPCTATASAAQSRRPR